MKFTLHRLGAVCTVLLMALLGITATTQSATASSSCANIGNQTPVIAVHGLNSNTSVWGNDSDDASMVHAIDQLSNVHVTAFDYSAYNKQWVTNDHIGPALAREISCEAAASRAHGGSGKVVLIGHSMGGLATRFAASQKVNGRSVASDIGLVITIGTPNLGSGLANAGVDFIHSLCPMGATSFCDEIANTQVSALYGLSEGSKELKDLPWLPGNIPTLAIAGDVTLHLHAFTTLASWNLGSDLVVAKNSALQDIREVNGSGGSSTISCDENVPFTHTMPACWHSGLPHNASTEQQVTNALKKYITNANPFREYASQKWGRHASQLTFSDKGTATMSEGMGYGLITGCGYWCAFNANLKLTPNSDGSITGTYTKVWYTGVTSPTGHTAHTVNNPSGDITTGLPTVGMTTKFALKSHDMLGVDGGPGYWCGPKTPLEWEAPCGA